ncbi:hypothetical protein, partial [Enterocloster clostridioformis]|uniref:hypothetical protein n=1 Tax=Enterocloster clostridioformis TaxID=1531 RepID=UPI001A99BCE4
KMKFSRKSSGITYLGLAVALATWYNGFIITGRFSAHSGHRTGVQKADQRTGTAGPAPEGAG